MKMRVSELRQMIAEAIGGGELPEFDGWGSIKDFLVKHSGNVVEVSRVLQGMAEKYPNGGFWHMVAVALKEAKGKLSPDVEAIVMDYVDKYPANKRRETVLIPNEYDVAYIDLMTDGYSGGTAFGTLQVIPKEGYHQFPNDSSDIVEIYYDTDKFEKLGELDLAVSDVPRGPHWSKYLKRLCRKHGVDHIRDAQTKDEPIQVDEYLGTKKTKNGDMN